MATDQNFDVRILERNLRKGLISKAEYDQYLAELPDMEAGGVAIEAEFVEGVLDDNASSEEE